jgi:amino acid transporter
LSEEQHEKKEDLKGLGWRVSLSILVGVGWLVFLLIWLFFYANTYSWEKKMAIFLLSLLVIAGILGIPWALWGLRHSTMQQKERWNLKGFRWRCWVSGIIACATFIFLIYWFWYLATPYNVYQNIAMFIVSFLVMGGILGAMWAPWGIKHGHDHHHDERKEE